MNLICWLWDHLWEWVNSDNEKLTVTIQCFRCGKTITAPHSDMDG